MSGRPDFPYYSETPVAVGATGWLVLLAALVLAFLSLTLLPLYAVPLNIVPILLFVAIPLAALALVTGRHWTALFRTPGLRDIGLMFGFGLLTIAASFSMALLVSHVTELHQNPIADAVRTITAPQFFAILAATVPQLIGEELLAILPFLALLWLLVTRLGLPRPAGIAIALIGSSLLFGAAHLPTYGWNWTQALAVIGTARVVLTLSYIVSRNLWVSAGAHVINDWAGFLLVYAVGPLPVEAG